MHRKVGICLLGLVLPLVFASSASAFEARGSVEQVWATGLAPGSSVTLEDSGGAAVATKIANGHGGTLFRNVAPGSGYTVISGDETSPTLEVLTQAAAPPSTDVYDQTVKSDGYGYITMRDGVKLAYATHPPSDIASILAGSGIDLGPVFELLSTLPIFTNPPSEDFKTPTLIEYSGYGTADPDGPESGIAILGNLMGYTVVDVNMRGTGCSGGAYDFFEPLQGLDGYDVIETVARQPWVKGGKVGMFGISFGGISQLFTAQNQPPSLAAITPLSVIDQTQTTLYPGGILNTGFAYSWAVDRVHDARPAPDGQPWANDQIADELAATPGSSVCRDNQALHPEAADLLQKIDENDHYVPEVADPLSPKTFVHKIDAPTFMACQWTDEQTGGHCPTLARAMLSGPNSGQKWFTFTNGTHVDSLAPQTLNRMFKFLEIYVNGTAPSPLKAGVLTAASPLVFDAVFGISGVAHTFETGTAVTPPEARAEWESQDPVKVLFDNGAGSTAGHPFPAFARDYDSYPADVTGRSWYLGGDGELTDAPSGAASADGFTADGATGVSTNYTDPNTGSGGLWAATPPYQWNQDPAGTSVSYATGPLAADTTVLGAGAVDVWVRSSKPNADLEVTISEIRPDGNETFVQGGWMRGDARALDTAKSTELEPVLSLRESDAQPLPADRFVKATIPLYYEGHVYRQDSRIRVRISAPGGDAPVWSFAETPNQVSEIAIGHGGGMPSRLVLPVTGDTAEATPLPPCPGLRGQPCRPYVEAENEPAPLELPAAGPGDSPSTGTSPGAATPKKCAKPKRKLKKKGKGKKKRRACKRKKKRKRKK